MSNVIPDGVDLDTARLAVAYTIAHEALGAAQELGRSGRAAEVQAEKLTNLTVKVFKALMTNSEMAAPEK